MIKDQNLKTILLVEDDQDLAELTSEYLMQHGYKVTVSNDGLSAVKHIQENAPDLVILDLMLPNLDGLEVCKTVRPSFLNPILMLTASNENVDEILGLEIGADDYLTKPVEPRLLLARIKALLRRASLSPSKMETVSNIVSINGLNVNDSARSVTLDNTEIQVSNVEYELLWLLIKNAGTVLSRDYIFENLRGIDYDGCNRTIDLTISRIRSKLGDNPSSPAIIKTVRNKGYLFST